MYSSTGSQQDRSQTWGGGGGGQKEANVTGVGFGYQISKLSWGDDFLGNPQPPPGCTILSDPLPFGQVVILL